MDVLGRVHMAKNIRQWFVGINVDVVNRPAVRKDQITIENLWRTMVVKIHHRCKQYKNVQNLNSTAQ